jgi:hypothetical protein
MAHRKVVLENAEWDVWDVRPQARAGSVGNGMENGWLCFQSGSRRRRLAPIPDGWNDLSDAGIAELFEGAREVHAVLTDHNEVIPRKDRGAHTTPNIDDRGKRGA